MKAVVFAGEGRVRVEDLPQPEVESPTDAVVRISLSAICGSDLHLLSGKTAGMRVGSVIGHEFVGEVTDAGATAGVETGTRVVGSFLIACGGCTHCSAGRYNFCLKRRALGLGTLTGDLDGAQAEYVRVPNAGLNLHPLRAELAGLADEQALFCGDVLATGFYAAALADAAPKTTVLVMGAGPIGLFTAGGLVRKGARTIVADTDAGRARFAQDRMGFESIHLGDDASAQVAEVTAGAMADIVVDAVGSIPAVKTGMRCVRDGGRIVVIGVYGAERLELSMGMAWVRGIELRFGGMANVQGVWDEALEAVRSGEVEPSKVVSHRLPIDEAESAYELFAARAAMKVLLLP